MDILPTILWLLQPNTYMINAHTKNVDYSIPILHEHKKISNFRVTVFSINSQYFLMAAQRGVEEIKKC